MCFSAIMTFYFSLRSLCRQLKNTPHFFSEYIFNSHYMFRHSGPDHMLLHTVLEQKDARLNFTFTSLSLAVSAAIIPHICQLIYTTEISN